MSLVAIALNDAGVLALRSDRPDRACFPPSPGYVLLDAVGLRTGRAAMARSRWSPRGACTSFWDALDDAPLPRPFPGDVSRADLAHAHLVELWQALRAAAPDETDAVVLAAPGWYTDEQLGLVVGIARACGMEVVGLVDLALAACASGAIEECASRLVHADIHLHRLAVSLLRNESALTLTGTTSLESTGLVALRDLWARLCAQIFVRETRFDPLHAAPTEQRLYDEIERAVGELAHRAEPDASLTVGDGAKTYSVEITRDELAAAAAPLYEPIVDALRASLAGGGDLLVSGRFATLPGLEAELARALPASVRVRHLPEAAAAAGALSHRRHLRAAREADELVFTTRLPRLQPREVEP